MSVASSRRWWALAGLLLAASCRSPDPAYYTLAPVRGVGGAGGPSLVELRRAGIAGYLDRSEIVRSNSPYEIKLNGGERWAEPFGDMFARVLAEDLNSRLSGTSVFTAAGAISADAGARVEIDLQRFNSDETGAIQLLAQVAVIGADRRAARTQTIRITIAAAGPSTAEYVAALSQALAQASDRIALLLRGSAGT